MLKQRACVNYGFHVRRSTQKCGIIPKQKGVVSVSDSMCENYGLMWNNVETQGDLLHIKW